MPSEHLTNFAVVTAVQLIFFLVHAYMVGETQNIKKYLIKGMILGLPFGIFFDLTILTFLGMAEYQIGIKWWFLVINGIFSYGFMVANVFLLQHHSLKHMYLWAVGLGVVYEITNYFFPVWEWTFAQLAVIEYTTVIFAAYAGLTALIMSVIRLAYKFHFRLIPF